MPRVSYVIRDGVLVEKHLAAPLNLAADGRAPAFIPDIEPFQSTIDGSVINSRAALRDHCKRHDVVPTADLKGLPPKTMNGLYQPTKQEQAERRSFIQHQVEQKFRRR